MMLNRLRSAKQNLALLILISCALPTPVAAFSPISAVSYLRSLFTRKKVDPSREQKKQMEQLMREMQKKMEYKQIALQVLNSEESYHHKTPSIVTQTEFEELQIGRLIGALDKTETSFGLMGLVWLLKPIAHEQEIKKRQTIIRAIAQDQKLFNELQQALRDIKQSEEALLNYWKKEYKLHNNVKNLFDYTGSLSKFCNKKESLLEASSWFVLSDALTSVAQFSLQAALSNVSMQLSNSLWFGSSTHGISLDFMWNNLKQSWYSPFRTVDPRTYVLNPDRADDLYSRQVQARGIFRDPSEQNWTAQQEENLQIRRMHVLGYGSLGDKFKFIKDCFQNGEYRACAAGMSSLTLSAAQVYWQYRMMKYSWDRLKEVYKISKDIHIEMAHVARLFRSLEKFEKLVSAAPALKMCNMQEHFQKVTNKNKQSKSMQELRALLRTSTFNEGGTLMHRRGRVLKAHKLLKLTKKEMVHAFQAIAEFDAYFSLAKVVKENRAKVAFVEFVHQQEPMIDVKKCWLPLISSNESVVNDVAYGFDNNTTKALITGPNGGGKSTYLKALGHALVLGQSIGIVAGQSARMSLFTGVRTSLAPKEDLSRGISTFMAQKERLKDIEDFMAKGRVGDKCLVMLDEPYSGTTDDEAANRIWALGKRAAQMPHCITLIATHVKKPIELAKDTKGVFANYQVEIDEPKPGQFKRTFKIKPGAAMWWFNDADRRSRFVDWLDDEIKREAQKRQIMNMFAMAQ